MLSKIIGSVVGTKNDRELKRMRKVVSKINAREAEIQALSDEQLQQKTEEFKARHQKGESLDALLPEAFAVCREASLRVNGMRHYDVQLIGGITLHEGKIAEMKTGEGKTLMGTLAMYLNAISGKGVHLVTVNDYLAARDAELNRPLFGFLGMTVGVIYSQQPPQEKIEAYQADITYGTNNEYGFDYLRDNMVFSLAEKKQRPLNFCIIDEIDSILIDEARTPLIISGQAEDSSRMYALINTIIPVLIRSKDEEANKNNEEEDFWIDEKNRQIEISEKGYEKIERFLIEVGELGENESLYSPSRLPLLAHVQAAIRAHHVFVKNVHYIVDEGEVVIVDENTGRTMPGRRWSEGLHQAVEAKENVEIQAENQTLATTTFQNYFRLYDKLSGMTGTADTEAAEFKSTYDLDVIVIPTHEPIARIDMDDQIFLTKLGKYKGIIREIKEIQAKGAPVLVGTATIEASEELSYLLDQEGVKHNVLNAKQHEREAEIIAQAGSPKSVTIATNMAGRGTDIILGGNWQSFIEDIDAVSPEEMQRLKSQWQVKHDQVVAAGGLHIIGSERHESRRIDNQLRGRAGRQGDPGMSRFFLSLEDDLMRIFAGDRVVNMMRAMGLKEDEAIEHKMVSKSIENAQGKVESRDFDARKNLLKYDDVANEQRKVIYGQRDDLLAEMDLLEAIEVMHHEVYNAMINQFIPPGSIDDQWNIDGLEDELEDEFKISMPINDWLDEDRRLDEEGLREKIVQTAIDRYHSRREQMGEKDAAQLERHFMLQSLDKHWKEHLTQMDQLRKGIHLRGYAQKNPEQEYKRESFELFQMMLGAIKSETVQDLSRVHIPTKEELEALEIQQRENAAHMQMQFEHDDVDNLDSNASGSAAQPQPQNRSLNSGAAAAGVGAAIAGNGSNANEPNPYAGMNISRNAACPCGSGLKYKQCHGKI
ncbi:MULTISPECIES: preprotein translocase subunit SecA [unclassified Psychrobacter]|uniref:preprotein translocase subunit SecA n=1 Tax=unclassified Psychrobacter TaxID=196806 RepID=UPI00086E74BB|nr:MULTISPECIES: preprotein translocase subunit SecA [unclassified Psychrobacter]OEH68190.1 MAG: preprotein translocase subunit SecA [Psychrobacter sp. B29-1]PKG67592.1 preprotein translocase subunit SecA [Psychrobacter sp. Choline-02u-13]PKH48779.1 preprotein translocase subunit SecA [Psychrobacter sp. Choline-02u-9]PKH64312.1 preprotein translocase subunit SecA [Psychrobacter sp. 4Dc]PLT20949.1 preprotein translocase subunit SecA [Psychrobacter sp. MES7-P7E]|tara:strand:- start:44223 stop:47024 length:2802 start_codon:yes stop_codon:yes gene_type:complete